MTTTTLVRPVARDDYASWRTLWDGYNAFYGRTAETSLSETVTAMTWARFFDAYEPVHALVAEHDGRLVGFAHYIFHRSTTAIEPSCYMQDLFTSENARGMEWAKRSSTMFTTMPGAADRPGSTGRPTTQMTRQ